LHTKFCQVLPHNVLPGLQISPRVGLHAQVQVQVGRVVGNDNAKQRPSESEDVVNSESGASKELIVQLVQSSVLQVPDVCVCMYLCMYVRLIMELLCRVVFRKGLRCACACMAHYGAVVQNGVRNTHTHTHTHTCIY
jgi:hypothetical protein